MLDRIPFFHRNLSTIANEAREQGVPPAAATVGEGEPTAVREEGIEEEGDTSALLEQQVSLCVEHAYMCVIYKLFDKFV